MATVATARAEALHRTECGAGEPLVLVHGSWLDGGCWHAVVPPLAEAFHIVAYDRRGHGASPLPPGPCGLREHAADLAALIETLDAGPAHVAGTSWGATIALRLAIERPDLVRSVAAHEPPLFDLVAADRDCGAAVAGVRAAIDAVVADLAAGKWEAGAARFVDTLALGPGSWRRLGPAERRRYLACAPAYLAQSRDPERMTIDLDAVAALDRPLLLSGGDVREPLFGRILDRLAAAHPGARRRLLAGTGHAPQLTRPTEYAAAVADFAARGRPVATFKR